MKQNTTYKQTELGLIPEDWEVKKLGEILKEYSLGGNYENNSEESGIPLIKMGNIGRGKIDLSKIEYLPKNVNYSKNDILKYNDILFNTRNTLDLVGKVSIWKNEALFALYNSNLLRLYFKEDFVENNDYVNFQFNSEITLANLKKYATGTTSVAAIYTKDLLKLKFLLPPLPEQKKIADCLSTWDVAIEKQNALINALTDSKKALMQQLLTGKKRLPGFSDEWKEVKLGSICENFQNGNAFSAKDYKKTGIPIVTMGNINLGGYFYFSESKSNFWIEDKSLERYEIKKGDLIIAMTDVTPEKNLIGLTSIIDIDRIFYLNQRVGHIILKPKLADTDFIFYLSQNSYWRNQCKAFATLGVQANLGTNDIKNINIKLPSLSEQTAIAEILATADRELQLQKEKLVQLQTQKKGLMQVLLTGKKRLMN